jgi:putative ABC transport system substrate-binding protein
MNRRDAVLGLVALGASPLGAYAQQQGKVWRVGFLAVRARSTTSKPEPEYDAFAQGLRELGYVEGKNLLLDWRSAEGKYERFSGMAAELVRMKADIIVTEGTPATQAAQRATQSIPIVTAVVADPVASGFAASLGQPGGNITGLSSISVDISAKQMELLKTMAPKLSRAAIFMNPDASHHPAILKNLQTAAKQIGVRVLPVNARSAEDIERGFAAMAREHAEAVIIASDAFFPVRCVKSRRSH